MLLDMEQHSALASLNMSHYSLSPGGGGGGGSPGTVPPPLYGSPPLYTVSQPQHESPPLYTLSQPAHPSTPPLYTSKPVDTACLFSFPGVGAMDVYPQTASQPSGSAANNELPDTKEGFEELCPVCGDKVSGYHYGLLTCESCKGFFKRTVQNKKVYTCVADRSCHIDKTQRKRCPFCRFQKCLEVGMKLEAVRADRMRGGRNKFGPMYKRDRARKLQMMRQRQIAVQTIRGSQYALGDGVTLSYPGSSSPFASLHIKQEIQIPQVSSLTSSPDSSPSPIAVALGQAGLGAVVTAGSVTQPQPQAGTSNQPPEAKLWGQPNSTTPSPHSHSHSHSISPKTFQFDGGSSGSSQNKISSPMIRDFVQSLDDREWQNSLYGLLQNQTYNQCEVDLFELMCKVLDQNLFSQVDWARNSVFFKDLKVSVDDQMKLLQHSWSDMLVLDHMHQRMHNSLPDETTLPNGQKFDLLLLGLLGVPSLSEHFSEITHLLQELKFDLSDYICVKFLLLLNPDVRGLMNRKHVQEGHDQVQQALLEYCVNSYPQLTDKFQKLLNLMPEIHSLASRGEEYLYHKHCNGSAPTQTLLMEMLHAKRK
ncbi:nuclear hormone receptor FTZ-F1 isoform X1 [Homalodisca vitripennis]|uniref:nuclear hormone receptor FTZ-F1 isoform X1 n=1 Tax=Homalodisca vitripennis TaxID=197043 RepID=UPI001EEAA715|nr:nuclear hormone receptor FTZ-F1 isoform X1 [Homalodisca vitripennis]